MAIRLLAIDDEFDILRLIRIKLEKAGFEVLTANNGEEGLAIALAEKPDVMLVDIMMPKKNGYQVVSEVREKLEDAAPIAILLSAKGQQEDVVNGLNAGAEDYIIKPFSPRELIERINVALIKSGKFPGISNPPK